MRSHICVQPEAGSVAPRGLPQFRGRAWTAFQPTAAHPRPSDRLGPLSPLQSPHSPPRPPPRAWSPPPARHHWPRWPRWPATQCDRPPPFARRPHPPHASRHSPPRSPGPSFAPPLPPPRRPQSSRALPFGAGPPPPRFWRLSGKGMEGHEEIMDGHRAYSVLRRHCGAYQSPFGLRPRGPYRRPASSAPPGPHPRAP